MDWFLYDRGFRHERVERDISGELKVSISVKHVFFSYGIGKYLLNSNDKEIRTSPVDIVLVSLLSIVLILNKYLWNDLCRE